MGEQADIAKLIGALDDLWKEGEHEEALAGAVRLTEAYPRSSEAFEKLALLRIHHAASNPPEDQLAPALDALNRALELESRNLEAREIRANLFLLLAHQLGDPTFFQHSLKDFLELEHIAPDESADRLARWRLEAARSAFLAARNSPNENANYALAAELFARTDPEALEAGDWFFRGLALRELAERNDSRRDHRAAAHSFLRALEVGGFETEARYFAADSLLSLDDLSGDEIAQAEKLVAELATLPRRDFVMDTLVQRLKLRKKLMEGNE
ncbi:MAG TPA: hypothetical protein PKH51_11820 [Candidatus Sumerlaeota bacterium]|nr:hypothetical protein [Candidatus Sumerlaeota bacterium]HNM47697.1 hypothetical protein [Candidatus Sumerlaeota bacterium]